MQKRQATIVIAGGFHTQSCKYYSSDPAILETSQFFKKLPQVSRTAGVCKPSISNVRVFVLVCTHFNLGRLCAVDPSRAGLRAHGLQCHCLL